MSRLIIKLFQLKNNGTDSQKKKTGENREILFQKDPHNCEHLMYDRNVTLEQQKPKKQNKTKKP